MNPNLRPNFRQFYCPRCEGAGTYTRSPSGYQNDPSAYDVMCSRCDATGYLQREHGAGLDEGLIPYTPSERIERLSRLGVRFHCAPLRIDPLIELARCRAINYRSLSYFQARRRAMAPVDLPIDDGHLLVTPETAAYFNALTRAVA